MKRFVGLFLFGIGFLLNTNIAAAEEIKNLRVTADADYLNIIWDSASSSIIDNTDGYAVQWSTRQTDVKIDKRANLYESRTAGISLRRASFDENIFYYTRIYTYTSPGKNRKALGNGSKMLKWKINYRNEIIDSSIIDVTDPIIVTNSSSENENSPSFKFGRLGVANFDSFADFSWSRPRGVVKSDYDGFIVLLSKNSDMKDPVGTITTDRKKWSLRVTDLSPETQYYAQGFFYKERGGEDVKFGDSSVVPFKTLTAIARDAKSVKSRNILKIEKRGIYKVSLNGGTTTGTTTETTTDVDETNKDDIKKRISEIKNKIKSLQSELNKWERKLDVTPTKTTTRTTFGSSKKKESLRDRLKRILAQKRAAKK